VLLHVLPIANPKTIVLSFRNDLWKYDIETREWTCIQESSDPIRPDEPNAAMGDAAAPNSGRGVKGPVPTRRFGYVSVVHNGRFILFGGFDGIRWLNDMYVFDFSSSTWTEIPASDDVRPSARSCPAWAKDDRYVYIQV
jgi:hypothetical protein